MGFSRQQVVALLADIDDSRVHKTQGQDHLESWDVRATLTRIFGFGGWSSQMIRPATLVFDVDAKIGKDEAPGKHVAYIATVRLTVTSPDGLMTICHEGSAIGDSKMGVKNRGDCHDMAVKTAESQALKRAAMNLGTQFGLSLYNDGSRVDVVAPMVDGVAPEPSAEEIQTALDTISALADMNGVRSYWRELSVNGLLDVESVKSAITDKGNEFVKAPSQAT